MYNLHAFEKIFFSLTVDYDVIDHVALEWLEKCSPGKINQGYELCKIPMREVWCLNLLDC